MRMAYPPTTIRRRIDDLLARFYDRYQDADFQVALEDLARWYHVKIPTIKWFEYIDGGTTAGRAFEDGPIWLQHPENWKRSKSKMQGKRKWIATVYHEFAHFMMGSEAEKKADTFARRFVAGLRTAEPKPP